MIYEETLRRILRFAYEIIFGGILLGIGCYVIDKTVEKKFVAMLVFGVFASFLDRAFSRSRKCVE